MSSEVIAKDAENTLKLLAVKKDLVKTKELSSDAYYEILVQTGSTRFHKDLPELANASHARRVDKMGNFPLTQNKAETNLSNTLKQIQELEDNAKVRKNINTAVGYLGSFIAGVTTFAVTQGNLLVASASALATKDFASNLGVLSLGNQKQATQREELEQRRVIDINMLHAQQDTELAVKAFWDNDPKLFSKQPSAVFQAERIIQTHLVSKMQVSSSASL